jgi:hypothetical protein
VLARVIAVMADLIRVVKRELKKIQYRCHPMESCLA